MSEVINGRHQLYAGPQNAKELVGNFRLLDREPYFEGSRLMRGDIFGNPIPVRQSVLPPGYVRLLCFGTGEGFELGNEINFSINGGNPVLGEEVPAAAPGVIREVVFSDVSGFLSLEGNGGVFHFESSQATMSGLAIVGQPLTVLDLSGQNAMSALDLQDLPELVSLFGLADMPLESITIGMSPNLKQIDISNLPNLQGFFLDENDGVIEEVRGIGTSVSGTFDLANQNLSAQALDQLFKDLSDGQGTITIAGNPGAAEADTSIATDKGYTVT